MRMANTGANHSIREAKKAKNNGSEKEGEKQYEFCKVCKLNHNQGRRHVYFPKHKKALSSFLSRFQSKLKEDVVFFLKNPIPLPPEHASLNRLWCVFCDCDIIESDSSFACANAITHFASAEHLNEVKGFLWKYGAGIDRVDSFRILETDFAKWEKKCKSLKAEAASEGSHGSTIGALNDIHNETNSDYVNSFYKNNILSRNFNFNLSNGVVPLQNHTDERSQVLHPETSGVTENGSQLHSVHVSVATGPYVLPGSGFSGSIGEPKCIHSFPREHTSYRSPTNGSVYPCERIINEENSLYSSNGDSGSHGSQNLTQISSSAQEDDIGNVHSGAPPPWFSAAERNDIYAKLNPGADNHVSSLIEPVTSSKVTSSKLNPKRVGAAWAERRKIELELERRGELLSNKFDDDWLPNFGRVWQAGSRKESRKEFLVESKSSYKAETQLEKPMQLQPYISKRMRRDAGE